MSKPSDIPQLLRVRFDYDPATGRPDGIPSDIWEAADAALDAAACLTSEDGDTIVIAHAIMAERERCAKKIDPLPLEADASSYEKQAYDLRLRFAAAIRGEA